CIVGPDQLFSACLAHIDYLGLCGAYVLDYATGRMADCGMALPFARPPCMPPGTTGDAAFQLGKTHMAIRMGQRGGTITVSSARCGGRPLDAEFHIAIPEGHETLNVVVPWGPQTFQFTSKQLCLPVEGELRWGDEVWRFERESSYAV